MTDPLGYVCGLSRLTVVRHGESTANVAFARSARTGDPAVKVVPEPIDTLVPLSDTGRGQARAAGRWLAGLAPAERPQAVVCSPYLRAAQTWETMAATARELGVEPGAALTDERLRDREMGVLELMTPAAVHASAPAESARRERVGEWLYRPPGGESLADVTLRVRDFLNDLSRTAPGTHVLLVAHDSTASAARQILSGIGAPPPDPTPVPNASVSQWSARGPHLHVTHWGSTTHLPP